MTSLMGDCSLGECQTTLVRFLILPVTFSPGVRHPQALLVGFCGGKNGKAFGKVETAQAASLVWFQRRFSRILEALLLRGRGLRH